MKEATQAPTFEPAAETKSISYKVGKIFYTGFLQANYSFGLHIPVQSGANVFDEAKKHVHSLSDRDLFRKIEQGIIVVN